MWPITVHIKSTGSPSTHIHPAILFFLKHQPNFISLDVSTHQPEVTKDGVFHRVDMSLGAGLRMLQTNVERFSVFHEKSQFQFSESF
jgi:hypothetical protein